MRFRPEIAIIHVHLAELLLDHYPDERNAAIEHLDFAIGELRAMKMQPMLERALRRKLQLQGVESISPSTSIDAVSLAVAIERPDLRPHAAPDGTVTLLFTRHRRLQRHDPAPWRSALAARCSVRTTRSSASSVQDHGGFEVKCQGDGFMLAFGSARRALECAVAIQQASTPTPQPPQPSACAWACTPGGHQRRGRLSRHHVVLAARIAEKAEGGEILVSELLRTLLGSLAGVEMRDAGRKQLKGLPGRHTALSGGVGWRTGASSARSIACSMRSTASDPRGAGRRCGTMPSTCWRSIPSNVDALRFLVAIAERAPWRCRVGNRPGASAAPMQPAPKAFANGRYQVSRLLGEGAKKRVFQAHDTRLGRDVAFALIKTDGLDATGRDRLQRETRAMARLGTIRNIVTVFDLGDDHGQPYLVSQLMAGRQPGSAAGASIGASTAAGAGGSDRRERCAGRWSMRTRTA